MHPTTSDIAALKGLQQWLNYLEQLHPKAIELGLDRVRAVAQRLFACPASAHIIVVGGTNGKGSTCAYLEAMLLAAEYQVGLYTSPHLLRYNERIRINGHEVDDAALVTAFAAIEAVRGDISLSYFEFGTLAALWLFRAANVEVMVLEVGLGGRLDAVNIMDADCAAVTSIDIDHTEYLGNTREAIAHEKAGIFRAGRPAVCGDPNPPAALAHDAHQLGANWRALGQAFYYRTLDNATWEFVGTTYTLQLPMPAMAGDYQLNNAATALAVLDALPELLPVAEFAIKQGLTTARLAGRFQCLPGVPLRILDVAHNPHGAMALAANLRNFTVSGRTLAVFAMLKDKDMVGVVRALLPLIDVWVVASLAGVRGIHAEEIAQILHAQGAHFVTIAATPELAWQTACALATDNDRIVAFGSFHTVAPLLTLHVDMPSTQPSL